jgi:hypothetical protein
MVRPLLLACLFAIIGSGPAYGDFIVAQYIFSNGSGASVPVSTTGPGVTASDLTLVGVTLATHDQNFFSGGDWPVGAFGNGYYQFTLAPTTGYMLDFSTAHFDYTIGTNPTFTTKLVTSVDGFTTPLSTHVNNAGITGQSDSLASLGLQNGPVTFRMYGQVDATSGQSGFYAGNMAIFSPSPPAVTPEPSSLVLILCGSGLFYCVHRRKYS